MNDRLAELADRRTRLQLKAAAQRAQLGVAMESIESRVRTVDNVLLKVRPLLRKPVLLAGGAALALFIGPGRLLKMAGRAMLLITAARRGYSLLQRFLPR
jgi:hypothetical protein